MAGSLSRADFMRFSAAVVGGLVGRKWLGVGGLTDKFEGHVSEGSGGIVEPSISEIIDLENIKLPREEIYIESRFTEGWEKQLGEAIPRIFDTELALNNSPIANVRQKMVGTFAKRVETLPPESKNVPPLKFQDLSETNAFKDLELLWDPLERLEGVIALHGIRTLGQLDIANEIVNLPRDDRRVKLWEKWKEVNYHYNKLTIFILRLNAALTDPYTTVSEDENNDITVLVGYLNEEYRRMLLAKELIEEELWMRLGNNHWDATEARWPNDDMDTSVIPNNICARHAVSVVRHMDFLAARPEDAPIFVDDDGNAWMQGGSNHGNRLLVDDNMIADWFVNESDKHGWLNISGMNLSQLKEHLSDNRYALIIHLSNTEPVGLTHMVIVRTFFDRGKRYLVVCDVSNKQHANPYEVIDIHNLDPMSFVGRLYGHEGDRFDSDVYVISKRII